jgi:hypothetical protein
MGQRSEQLAQQFEDLVSELANAIEGATDDQWQAVTGGEGWTVAGTAHHVGAQFPLEMEYITAAAEGREMPSYTWDDINKLNESRAEENRSYGRSEAAQLLREGAAVPASYVRSLSDEQLDRTAPLPLANGAEVSTQQLIEGGVLIDHVRSHLASIRAVG